MDPWTTLRDEYFILQEELFQNDTPIQRRNFVRAVCSNVEGTLNWLMQQLAENASALSEPERLAFEEKQVTVKENGQVEISRLLLKAKVKIKMVFKFLAKYPGGDKLDLSDNNFSKLIASFKVRDRLMHPRNNSDLEVSESEVQDMIDGYRWYIKGYQSTLKSIGKELEP
jgi:hypothetical protein